MSLIDKLNNLFTKKSGEPTVETSGELSLAMPDGTLDPMMVTGAHESGENQMAMAPADPDSIDDSISIQVHETEPKRVERRRVDLVGRSHPETRVVWSEGA